MQSIIATPDLDVAFFADVLQRLYSQWIALQVFVSRGQQDLVARSNAQIVEKVSGAEQIVFHGKFFHLQMFS